MKRGGPGPRGAPPAPRTPPRGGGAGGRPACRGGREGVQGLVELQEALPPTRQRRAEDPAWWEWERRWLLAQNVEGIVACHLGLAEAPGIPLARLGEIQAPTLLV